MENTSTMPNSLKIQGVMNTIEQLEPIRPTADNASRLWGIFRTLMEVRDDLYKQDQEAKKQTEEPAEVKEDADGEADAE